MFTHPLLPIAANVLRRYFLMLLLPTILCMVILSRAGRPLVTPAAPRGMLSLELHGLLNENASSILESWNANARQGASFGLGFDYLFIVFYSALLSIGCIWVTQHFPPNSAWFGLGIVLAWGQAAAAIFDCVENAALLVTLFSNGTMNWIRPASIASAAKWIAVIAGVLYIVIGWTAIIFRKDQL